VVPLRKQEEYYIYIYIYTQVIFYTLGIKYYSIPKCYTEHSIVQYFVVLGVHWMILNVV
jgi:hypothetical protein